MKRLIHSILSFTLTLTAACGQIDEPAQEPSTMSKEQAQSIEAKADNNVDLCERYQWYGDGVCDEFCDRPDPDCQITCKAVPSCSPEQDLVDPITCEELGDQCQLKTMCGHQIGCVERQITCLALPSCDEGDINVDPLTCANIGERCEVKTMCGQAAYCVKQDISCIQVLMPAPQCPAGADAVEACDLDSCFVVWGQGSNCNDFVLCQ